MQNAAQPSAGAVLTVPNALARYHAELQPMLRDWAAARGPAAQHRLNGVEAFAPAFRLPELTPEFEHFLAASDLAVASLPDYRGRPLRLLDLRRNPGARTTKTMASLVIVGRAVKYIQDTGERVMIVTPSSANKATALRDAVLRALEAGLVDEGRLQIATVVPAVSQDKLWSSRLSTDPRLRALNPMILHEGPQPAAVKDLATGFVARHAERFRKDLGVNLWYTLDLRNYMAADIVRALVERDHLPTGRPARMHAHAVSSAFGLLGHDLGHRLLREAGTELPTARYFLVQHLGAPDMVLSLRHGSPDLENCPEYRLDPADGLYRQNQDPHFPWATFDPREELDPTFYTRRPVTSAAMDPIIARQGGDGIVVSLAECLERYAFVRELLSPAQIDLPADPRRLREWSIVMAMTGVLNGVDRGLVEEGEEIVVHASGSYTAQDYTPLPAADRGFAADEDELAAIVERAALAAAAAPKR